MILRKGMRVLVNAGNIGHPPNRSYPVTAINQDSVFIEGWWDRLRNCPLHVPKDWIWPLLDPSEQVVVGRMPHASSLVSGSHRNAGIWTVERTICHDFFDTHTDFSPIPPLGELPCVIQLLGVRGFFDPRYLDDPADVASAPDPVALKAANTSRDARFCAACGGPLKDPGMGPMYKHCPRCEP